MKRYILIIWLLTALIALTPGGCAAPSQINASPGQEFTLAIGQEAAITGESITIEFVSVTSDSRCPQGVTCVWAGEVTCLIKIALAGKAPVNLELKQSGVSDTPAAQDFDGYTINFKVTPYPVAGKEIAKKDYRLTMTVNNTQAIAVIEPAPIEKVEIAITLSMPPQVFAVIQGGLRDSCTTFHSLNTTRSGGVINVNVYVQHLTNRACAEVYTLFEKNVNLGSDFVSGQSYTVNVNGKATNFTMP